MSALALFYFEQALGIISECFHALEIWEIVNTNEERLNAFFTGALFADIFREFAVSGEAMVRVHHDQQGQIIQLNHLPRSEYTEPLNYEFRKGVFVKDRFLEEQEFVYIVEIILHDTPRSYLHKITNNILQGHHPLDVVSQIMNVPRELLAVNPHHRNNIAVDQKALLYETCVFPIVYQFLTYFRQQLNYFRSSLFKVCLR